MTVVGLKGNVDPSCYRPLYGQERNQRAGMFEARHPSVEERLAADQPDPVDILEKQNVEREATASVLAPYVDPAAGSLV